MIRRTCSGTSDDHCSSGAAKLDAYCQPCSGSTLAGDRSTKKDEKKYQAGSVACSVDTCEGAVGVVGDSKPKIEDVDDAELLLDDIAAEVAVVGVGACEDELKLLCSPGFGEDGPPLAILAGSGSEFGLVSVGGWISVRRSGIDCPVLFSPSQLGGSSKLA